MNNILEEKPITLGSNLFQYISEVNKIPILTEEEELDYAQKKDKGDINAAKMLISTHLRLVVKISSNYKNYGLPMMDIISEGNIGLMRAVKTFDYRKGYKLATYAMWWIKAYIQEYILRSWSIVRIGTNSAQKKLFFNLKKIKNVLSQLKNVKVDTKDFVKKKAKAKQKEKVAISSGKYSYILEHPLDIKENIKEFLMREKNLDIPLETIDAVIGKYLPK